MTNEKKTFEKFYRYDQDRYFNLFIGSGSWWEIYFN